MTPDTGPEDDAGGSGEAGNSDDNPSQQRVTDRAISPRDFLYVPLAAGEKIPLAGWQWSGEAPDGVPPRSEANPYALTYEQTTDPEILSKLREGWPDWAGRFGIIGARGDAYWTAHDLDLEGHDETFDRPEDVEFDQRKSLGVDTSNGVHIHHVFESTAVEWRESVEAHSEPGVDVLGDVPDETGIAVSPFHVDAYEVLWRGEPVIAPPDGDLIACDGDPWFIPRTEERRAPAAMIAEFEPRSDLERIPLWEIFPDLRAGNQAHPVHGSTGGNNLLVDEHGCSGYCFRDGHDCFYTTPILLAVRWGFIKCGQWSTRTDFPDDILDRVYERAYEEGLIDHIPDRRSGGIRVIPPSRSNRDTSLTADDITVIDGPPRYAHKTTEHVQAMTESEGVTVTIAPNHELASEVAHHHLAGSEADHGADESRIVHLKGQARSCTDCPLGDHSPDGGREHGRHKQVARSVLGQTDVVTPEAVAKEYDDFCPYYVCNVAVGSADHIVTVAQKAGVLTDQLDAGYELLIDEESTLHPFLPDCRQLFSFRRCLAPWGPDWIPNDGEFDREAAVSLRDRIQSHIERYDRVPAEYRNALRAAEALVTLNNRITEICEAGEDLPDDLEAIDVPEVGFDTRRQATFEYIRTDLRRERNAACLEPILVGARLHVQQAQGVHNVYLAPNPASEYVHHRELFEQASHIRLVGLSKATYFIDRLGVEYETKPHPRLDGVRIPEFVSSKPLDADDLTIFGIPKNGSEPNRRGAIAGLAGTLAKKGVSNLLVAGSKQRARQARQNIDTCVHVHDGQSDREEFEEVVERGGWTVIATMNGRLTRGVDISTSVTLCRSKDFATPRWSAYPDYRYLASYERCIELRNAMLRGARTGEPHVAVVPELAVDLWGESEFEITDADEREIVRAAWRAVGIPVEGSAIRCRDCDTIFVSYGPYSEHGCESTVD